MFSKTISVLSQQDYFYDDSIINLEFTNTINDNVWIVYDGQMMLDTIHKHSGNHSIKIVPFNNQDSIVSNFNYLLSTYVVQDDQQFYRIEGDSLELRGLISYRDAENADLTIILRQQNDYTPLSDSQFELKALQENSGNEWIPFRIKAPVDEMVNLFNIRVSTSGNINVWVDDLQLTIDGCEATTKYNQCFKADLDCEFDNGSNVSFSSMNEVQIENLRVLAKIWGFVKYYHPEVAKGKYQWDYALFRLLPKIIGCEDIPERNQRLTAWLREMNVNLEQEENPLTLTAESYVIPKLNWINDDALFGSDLVMELNRIRNNKRTNTHYYINIGACSMFFPDFSGEKRYPQITWEDQGYRILSLFRYWNAIEYCFPYKDLTDLDWDRVLEKYLQGFVESKDEIDYYRNLFALTAEINDSHGWIRPFSVLKKNMLAANFLHLEDKMVVRKSYTSQLKAGDIVLKIDDRDVNDIIDERKSLVCASNEPKRKDLTVEEMNWWNEDSLRALIVRDNDTISTYYTDFNLREPIPDCISEIQPYDYQDELKKKNIMHLRISDLSAASLTAIEDSIMSSEGIILDCRVYPSHDSFYFKMSEMLFPHSLSYMEISPLDVQYPGHFRLIPELKVGGENPEYYKKPIILLVNGSTQSASETAVLMFQAAPNSITVGSQSSGANGAAVHYHLPCNFLTIFTGQGCYYPDKGQLQRVGVKIDVSVSQTINLFLQGRDDQLEKAIELIN